jgi:hypothetical protein
MLRNKTVEDNSSQKLTCPGTDSVIDHDRDTVEVPPSEDNVDVHGGGNRIRKPPTWLQDYVLE